MKFKSAPPKSWKYQPNGVLNQANPVSGTKYTVLDVNEACRIYDALVLCTWTVQPSPLELHFTIDGETFLESFTDPVTATSYRATRRHSNSLIVPVMYLEAGYNATNALSFVYEGKAVKIEAEISGGTVSGLDALIKHALLRP